MEGTKTPFTSKTFWGSLLVIGTGLAPIFGVGVPADTVQTGTELIMEGLTVIGGLVALFGRFSAQKKIRF